MKKYVLLALVIIGLMSLNGCVPRNNLIEADENMIKNCKFVGTFDTSYYTRSGAKAFATKQAEEKGATHVIYSPIVVQSYKNGQGQYLAEVKGYKCNGSNSTSTKKSDENVSNTTSTKKATKQKKVVR